MNSRTRNIVLSAIYNFGTFTQSDIRGCAGKSKYTKKVDNSIGRFVRRLAEGGYVKRTANGYKITARGRKMVERNTVNP